MAVPLGTVTRCVGSVSLTLLETLTAFGVAAFLGVATACFTAWFLASAASRFLWLTTARMPATSSMPVPAAPTQSLRLLGKLNISYLLPDNSTRCGRRYWVDPFV